MFMNNNMQVDIQNTHWPRDSKFQRENLHQKCPQSERLVIILFSEANDLTHRIKYVCAQYMFLYTNYSAKPDACVWIKH